jgi:PAS domain S-box-containing protein
MPKKPTISPASARLHKLHALKARGPMAELYRRAEVHLSNQQKRNRKSKSGVPESDDGPERLLHELEVHQIELELQNAELQKTRDELEVALEKFTDLYDFAPVGYFSLDESAAILESNLTGAALLGLDRSRLMSRRLLLFMAPNSRPVFLAFLEKVFAGATNQSCEIVLQKAGGAPFWADCQATLAVALKGTPKWCRVAVSDIALRKQAEALLRRNEALFTTLIEQAPLGVYVVDEQLRLQQVNPRAQPVFKQVQPLQGRDLSEIMRILWPEKTANEVVARFRKTLKTGQPYFSPEFSELRRDTGVKESYEWQLQCITLPDGNHGVVCFFTDITERKRVDDNQRRLEILTASNRKLEAEITRRRAVELALKQSEQHQIALLEQSHHMQAQLRHLSRQVLKAQEEERKRISRELHDVIAQTLTGINVRLANLKKEAAYNTKGLGRKIARTQQLVEHSVNIVHQFARELRPTALDDLGLIPALHTFMKGFKQETGIQVSLSAEDAVEQVDGDQRTVLYRVAQEALHNIARHAHAGHAHVIIQKQAGAVCLKIEDDGKGFEAERAAPSKKDRRLGLLGMRERVEMVNGRFRIESTPGKGTTIIAEVPLATRGGGGRKTRARDR